MTRAALMLSITATVLASLWLLAGCASADPCASLRCPQDCEATR